MGDEWCRVSGPFNRTPRAEGGAGTSCAAPVADVVLGEAARRPTSKPLSVSPRARPHGPTFGCRTPRARDGPPRTSAPTTHPAPTRPGARSTRAAPGAWRPNGPGARSTRAAPGVGLSWRTRWRMKPRASQPQNHSPCPRASPCSVLTGRRPGPRSGRAGARPSRSLSDTPRTGRAAEDVGPYHPSCPDAARRAKYPRRPRRRAVKWWRLHAPDRQ